MLATSLPASGSVMAMHDRFLQVKRSGRNRSWSSGLPNLITGGTPYAMPAQREVGGPLNPDRDIYRVQF